MQNTQTIAYKMEYSILECVFGLIGPAIILISILYPIPDMKIGNLWLHLPPGVANIVLGVLGIFVTYVTARTLLEKRAANSQGASIVFDEDKITFTAVQRFRGVLTAVNFDAIEKVILTNIPETSTEEEVKTVEIRGASLKPKWFLFDADCMATDADFDAFVHTLKSRAVNAVFERN